MALTQGTVTIAADGTVTKSGESGTLFDLLVARANIAQAKYGQPAIGDGAGNKDVKDGLAGLANDLTSWLLSLLTARASVKIPNSSAGDGLQTTPNPNNPDTACKRPAADKFLSIV